MFHIVLISNFLFHLRYWMQTSEDDEQLMPSEPTPSHRVYRRRWYILFIFSLITMSQAATWNTWGPIAVSSKEVYGWNNFNIALLPNWGSIMYLFGFIPTAYLIRRYGKE